MNLTNTISDTINIDILSVHPNDLTVYMDTLIAIPLETTETSLFGAIDKIVVWDSMI